MPVPPGLGSCIKTVMCVMSREYGVVHACAVCAGVRWCVGRVRRTGMAPVRVWHQYGYYMARYYMALALLPVLAMYYLRFTYPPPYRLLLR